MLTPRASSTIPMCIYLTDILAPERDALLASPPFPSSFSSFSSFALDRMNAACFPCASTHRSSDRFFNSPSRDCIFSRDVDSAEATIEDHVDITSESLYMGREGRGRSVREGRRGRKHAVSQQNIHLWKQARATLRQCNVRCAGVGRRASRLVQLRIVRIVQVRTVRVVGARTC